MEQIRSFREGSPTGAKPLPPVDELRKKFFYKKTTGELFWRRNAKSPQGRRPWDGKLPAGKPNELGYIKIRVGKSNFSAHRLIWAIVHGEDPGVMLVDHIDHNPLNNRIENLRLVTHRENLMDTRRGPSVTERTREAIMGRRNPEFGIKGLLRTAKLREIRVTRNHLQVIVFHMVRDGDVVVLAPQQGRWPAVYHLNPERKRATPSRSRPS